MSASKVRARRWLSPASRALEKRVQSREPALNLLVLTCATFLGGIVLLDVLLVRLFHLSKVAWSRIGQLTIIISFVALILASWSFYSNRLNFHITNAEIAAKAEAEKGLFFVTTIKRFCRAGYTISLAEDWLEEDSKRAEYQCDDLMPALNLLEQYWFRTLTSKIQSGQFIDPYWKIGLPVDLDTNQVQGQIMGIDELDAWQKEVLLTRVHYFMDPYIRAMRFIQSQQDNLLLAESLQSLASLWAVAVSFALAMNFTRSMAERRLAKKDNAR